MKLNFKVMGEGHPLIILHGLLGALDNWQTVGRYFSKQYKVYLVDQRNHGKSPHNDEMNYDLMAADLKELMQQEQVSSAHILGHSMGGKTVMNFALKYPEMVDKLIVADIGPKLYPHGHDQIFKALFALDPAKIESRNDAEEKMKYYILNQGIRLFLLKNLLRNKDGSYSWKMNLQGIYDNYENILEEITSKYPFEKPTLFIRGGKSDYIADNDIPGIKALFPKATIQTIEGVGHWVHSEAQKEFIRLTEEFLVR